MDLKNIMLGDANIHLSYVFEHSAGCTCPHCRQRVADNDIEDVLTDASLKAWNIPVATHVSGTLIDLVLGHRSVPRVVATDDVWIHQSDHRLIFTNHHAKVHVDCAACSGRVAWASSADWDS